MSESFYHEVTDKQWETRKVFNAICLVLSSGAKWRYLPQEYGNWNSIYHKFRKWIDEGVFKKILQALIEIDSTFCKVHPHALKFTLSLMKIFSL